jgi:hypothetical protein
MLCKTFLPRGPNNKKTVLAGHFVSNAYIFYLCVIDDNTVSSLVPVLGRQKPI